jgi:hypothetical protein
VGVAVGLIIRSPTTGVGRSGFDKRPTDTFAKRGGQAVAKRTSTFAKRPSGAIHKRAA